MSSTAEVHAAQIIANIEGGVYPREAVLTIARGFLPLPQDDLIAVLAFLTASEDAEVSELAHNSLVEIPIKSLVGFAANENVDSSHLELLMLASEDTTVLETLIRNRGVSDDAIVKLARVAPPPVQEIIVINQARIIRAPQILEALLENPSLSTDARRRTLENREEFFDKKERIRALQEELGQDVVADIPMDAIADLLEQAEKDTTPAGVDTVPAPPAEADDDKGRSIWSRILKMTVSEKVQLAFKGDKTVRTILVRERNRLVAAATMRNPRMTENEVESIAGMRNVEEEVLRLIGNRRDWTTKYPIALALIKNPKAPLGVVLPLINRLTLRDLKGLKDDKGVSEAVRVNAKKFYQSKQK
jgi:hypothetical protein